MLNDFMCALKNRATDLQTARHTEGGDVRSAKDDLVAHVENYLGWLLAEDWKRQIVSPEECIREDLRKLERTLGEEFNL